MLFSCEPQGTFNVEFEIIEGWQGDPVWGYTWGKFAFEIIKGWQGDPFWIK